MKQPLVIRVYKNDTLESVKQFDEVDQVVMGRNEDSQVCLPEESISPLHAIIEKRDTGYYVSDLGSLLGTYVNGEKTLDQKLASGDEIKIGPFKLEFFIGVPKPTAPPKAKPLSEAPPPLKDVKAPPAFTDENTEPIIMSENLSGADLSQILRPEKGTVVEVVVAWQDRVLSTHHFKQAGSITMGADENKNQIVLPSLGGPTASTPLLKIGAHAIVCISERMGGEHITPHKKTKISDLIRSNKLRRTPEGLELDLAQGEMVRLGLNGDLVSIYIRYVPEAPKPLALPLFDLTASEMTAVILSGVISAIFALYMMVYAPTPITDESRLEEPIRKARIEFKPPKRIVEQQVVEAKEPPKKKVVTVVKDKPQQQAIPKTGDPGQAASAKPVPNKKNDSNKLVSTKKQGGAVNTGAAGANAESPKKDVSQLGLLGVFGKGGSQSNLDKTYSGAGELIGVADSKTGSAGFDSNRAGEGLGTAIKDTGGGQGKATVGISGPGTLGRGSGSYGYGTGGLGKKTSMQMNIEGQEAQFVGSIDREAIRRVIIANRKSIRACYELALNRNPDLYGKLVLEWDIEEEGRVTRAVVKSNSLGNDEVAQCILRRLKTWTFPEPPPDQIGRVVYPFVFTAQ